MLSIWDKWGVQHGVTVVHLDNCQVVQVKTDKTDGYTALQLGVGEAKLSRVNMPARGHFRAAGDLTPNRKLSEFRVSAICCLCYCWRCPLNRTAFTFNCVHPSGVC